LLVEVELGDVVEEDEEGEEDDADEGYLVDELFELLVDVAAHDAFDEEEEDHAAVEWGDGQEIEDAEVERDEGHEFYERPDAHLGGDIDLLGDADGAAHLLDGDVAGEEAVEDAEDELGALAIVLVGLDEGGADGEALDVDGWLGGLEAEAELRRSTAVHLLRRDGDGDGLALALDGEHGGCTVAVLEIGEQGIDRVQLERVDADDLIALLETGAVSG